MPQCEICNSRNRSAIESDIPTLGVRGTARRHNLDKSAVSRHTKHMKLSAAEPDVGHDVVLNGMVAAAAQALGHAQRKKDSKGILAALDALRGLRKAQALDSAVTPAGPREPIQIKIVYDPPIGHSHQLERNLISMLASLIEKPETDAPIAAVATRLISLLQKRPLSPQLEEAVAAEEAKQEETNNGTT
jgi:hypothetical protein